MNRGHPKFIAALLAASGCAGPAKAQWAYVVQTNALTGSMRAAEAVMAQPGITTHYTLSNERSLHVTPFADGLLVGYGRHPTTLLRPDGRGNFLSRDGRVTLSFDGVGRDGHDRVYLLAPPLWL